MPTPTNASPVLVTNYGLTVIEGATETISGFMLQTVDFDNSAAQLIYTLKNLPINGTLKLNGSALSINQTFTQDDINNYRLSYQHGGGEKSTDTFSFNVTDIAGNTLSLSNPPSFNIRVMPVNDASVLVANKGKTVGKGETVTITNSELLVTDADNTPTQLIYSLQSIPTNGTLKLNNIPLFSGQTFTQADIYNNRLTYQHNNSEATSDSFSFTVWDGSGGSISSTQFNIVTGTVNLVPHLLKDLNQGSGSSSLTNLTNVNGTLYFSTQSGELWKSDGTEAGTVLIQNINGLSNLTNVNGTLFFAAYDGVNGMELWKSDGITTVNVPIGLVGSNPGNLTNVNGTLYFTAYDAVNGNELWKSDGTVAGTFLVKDINPGLNSSNIANLTNVDGTLYFTANEGAHGLELWMSDGSATGTMLVQDINPGLNSSNPSALTNVNGTLYFAANDGVNGTELWVV